MHARTHKTQTHLFHQLSADQRAASEGTLVFPFDPLLLVLVTAVKRKGMHHEWGGIWGPRSEQNPNATADVYLGHNRQFDVAKMIGWYEQGSYKDPKTNEWCDTVRVYLDKSKTYYWERLIDWQKDGGQRIKFGGKRKPDGTIIRGEWWMPPKQKIKEGDTVYLVEGI